MLCNGSAQLATSNFLTAIVTHIYVCYNTFMMNIKKCAICQHNKAKTKKKSNSDPVFNTLIAISALLFIGAVCLMVWVLSLSRLEVSGGSMYPTYFSGEMLESIDFHPLITKRYDVVSFNGDNAYGKRDIMLKRIIGLPGDTIELTSEGIVINSMLIDEPYTQGKTYAGKNGLTTFHVPEDCYFLLGDNRTDSFDSRSYADPFVSFSSIRHVVVGSIHDQVQKANESFGWLFLAFGIQLS